MKANARSKEWVVAVKYDRSPESVSKIMEMAHSISAIYDIAVTYTGSLLKIILDNLEYTVLYSNWVLTDKDLKLTVLDDTQFHESYQIMEHEA